jgi:hypothetical protein
MVRKGRTLGNEERDVMEKVLFIDKAIERAMKE